jgi:predicted metal-binding protein
MGAKLYFKCPGNDPVSRAVPELFVCPDCGVEVEIWTDEFKGKCASCNRVFRKDDTTKAGEKNWYKQNVRAALKKLTQLACQLGASDAKVISTPEISVEDGLANLCREPGCENYGLSTGCPPHVTGPDGFRKLLKTFDHAVVFKIDVPSEILLSDERRDIFRLLHEIAASIEQAAIEMEFHDSNAYAGGSCKQIFCRGHPECRVLGKNGECRNPLFARPSMSGFGINVLKLKKAAGWMSSKTPRDTNPDTVSMETVCGLVLIG